MNLCLANCHSRRRSIVNWTLISVALSLTCTDSGLCTLHKNNLKQKRSSKVTWASRRFPFILRYHCFPEQANFTVSAFNLVCVKIPLCNGACYDKSDGTVFLLFAVEWSSEWINFPPCHASALLSITWCKLKKDVFLTPRWASSITKFI